MGPISLTSLVIVLCLAVMCVLTVATAHAIELAAARQMSATTDIYACESAGQEFLANVDSVLAQVRTGQETSSGEAISDLETAAGEGEDSGSVALSEQTVESSGLRDSALQALRDADKSLLEGFTVEGISAAVDISESNDALPSLTATFVTENDRRLSISLAINDDATYRILSWKTTTFWNNKISTDTLWSGETD